MVAYQRSQLLPLKAAAVRLRIPAEYLQAEAEAGRLPHLRAGDAILFNAPALADELLRRAAQMPEPGGGIQ